MGGIFKGIFGGSSQKSKSSSQSTSYNQAYPWLQQTYGPQATQGFDATNAYRNLLGLDGPAAFNSSFNDYLGSTDYGFKFGEGQRAVTGSNAAKGMLNSGDTLKRLTQYGTDIASQYFEKFLDRLLGLSEQGIKIGQLIGGAGNYSQATSTSTSKGSSTPGLAGLIGSVLSAVPKG